MHINLLQLEQAIAAAISRKRITLQSEAHLQELVARVLSDLGIPAEREKHFSRRDRVDFWIPGEGLAIEIKLRMAGVPALRQVRRYLEHQDVVGALLIASRVSERTDHIQGKPVRIMELWRFNV